MSIPRICTKCGETVGVVNPGRLMRNMMSLDFDGIEKASTFNPAGPCNHPEPNWIKKTKFFGLIEEVTKIYPDGSISRWEKYVGKPGGLNLLLLLVYVKLFRHDIFIHDWIFHDLTCFKEIYEQAKAKA